MPRILLQELAALAGLCVCFVTWVILECDALSKLQFSGAAKLQFETTEWSN